MAYENTLKTIMTMNANEIVKKELFIAISKDCKGVKLSAKDVDLFLQLGVEFDNKNASTDAGTQYGRSSSEIDSVGNPYGY